MKTMREQVIERIGHLGGEKPEYYIDYSDYDILEDYENLLRNLIEEEFASVHGDYSEQEDEQ